MFERLKKYPVLFYLIQAAALALAVVFTLLMPKQYIYWNLKNVVYITIMLFFSYAINGALLAFVSKTKLKKAIIIIVVSGAVGAAMPYIMHNVFNLLIKWDLYMVMRLYVFICFVFLAVLHFKTVFAAADEFSLKKSIKQGTATLLAIIFMSVCLIPFSQSFFNTYLRKYSFLTMPSVFVAADDNYAVMFATSGPGTALLTVEKDGVKTEFAEVTSGNMIFNSQIHKIIVPQSVLDGASYTVSSKQALDTTGTVYRMGKTIVSDVYTFKAYSGDGDVSFLCVSDNQGSAKPTYKAVSKAALNSDYDFVMMLGDNSEAYNETEEDFINSLLKVSGIAGKGTLPIYYTLGNHEYRGVLSATLFDLMPTPSESGEFYYSFTMGDAYFTVLNFSNEDSDENERYGGIARYNEYKDKEYEWLTAKFAEKEYEGYRYNVMISHIGVINEKSMPASEYKCKDILDALQAAGVQYVVSGHSHVEPQEFKSSEYSFKNLHCGSYYNGKKQFRNSIIRLKDGTYSFEVYDSKN